MDTDKASRGDRTPPPAPGGPGRVTLAYVAVSALWIVVSDFLAGGALPRVGVHTLKGLAFVAVTGALLHVLMRHMLRRVEASHAAEAEARERLALAESREREREAGLVRESEARYRRLFEGNSAVMLLVDASDGRIVAANAAAVRFYMLPRERLESLNISDINTLPREELFEAIRKAREGGRMHFGFRHRLGDGTQREVEVYAGPVSFGGRELLHSIVYDVSQLRSAQEALRDSERRLTFALQRSRTGGWELDLRTRAATRTAEHDRIFGYAQMLPAWTYEDFLDHVLPQDRPEVDRRFREAVASRGEWNFECRIRRADGEVRWIWAAGGHEAPPAEGAPERLAGIVQDITERKRVEVALRESEERFATVFHASPIAIVISRFPAGAVLEINPAGERLWGHGRGDCLGRTLRELGMAIDEEPRADIEAALRETGGVDAVEATTRNRSGEAVFVAFSARRVTIAGEDCLVSLCVDQTERRRLDEARMRSQKLESLGTLAGGIAHDFNNILSAIRGNAELVAQDLGSGHPARESLEEVRKAGLRASELVRRITAFGRPDEPSRGPVALGESVLEVLKLLRPTIDAGIAFETRLVAHAPPVLADSAQVHEALVNLATNAAHAIGRRTGTIAFVVEPVHLEPGVAQRLDVPTGRYTRLTVRDDGCGMDAATQSRVFDAYFTTKPAGEGSGLGLSMVYGIMKGHGGAVTVESEPGRGASFHLLFPSAEAVVPAATPSLSPSPPPAAGRGRRLLFVDDEVSLVGLAQRALTRLGHRVTGFTDPREALAAFRARPGDFDAVVTDLTMPQMTGYELAGEVRALRPDIPVILATGYARDEDLEAAAAAGIVAVLPKGSTLQEFAVALDGALATPPAAGPR